MARIRIILFAITAALLSSCAKEDPTPINPYLDEVMNITAPMTSLRFKRFGTVDGWVIWYFQNDFGAKCVGTKPAQQEQPAVPQAVFVRQTTGDLRVDIWLDDGNVIIRVPTREDGMNPGTRGFYRAAGESFFQTIFFDDLKKIGKGKIELKPEPSFLTNGPTDTLVIDGIAKAETILRACDRSVPVH